MVSPLVFFFEFLVKEFIEEYGREQDDGGVYSRSFFFDDLQG